MLAHPREFTIQLSSTRRGARLARRLATQQLAEWGWGYDSDISRTVALLVGELAANAVQHGRLPGRDFGLRVAADSGEGLPVAVRIEVSDVREHKRPPAAARITAPPPEAESGRGLLLVCALATRWGTTGREPVGKTIWCELEIRGPGRRA
ncbi:ATP-binding protein [Streptomyces sp. NPDC048845]|uniref:ATP-binding protein n=1 Tax=Streptomyces sp. NPDC048845 TaxID=3155390 RepID=UPI00343B73E2